MTVGGREFFYLSVAIRPREVSSSRSPVVELVSHVSQSPVKQSSASYCPRGHRGMNISRAEAYGEACEPRRTVLSSETRHLFRRPYLCTDPSSPIVSRTVNLRWQRLFIDSRIELGLAENSASENG